MTNRWYDNNNHLSKMISSFKDMNNKKREEILFDTLSFIEDAKPDIRSKIVFEDPRSETYNNRWYDKYDKYPYIWMLFHMLQYADKPLLDQIDDFLQDKLF